MRKLPDPKPPLSAAQCKTPLRRCDLLRDLDVGAFTSAGVNGSATLTPLAPERYKVQFTVSRETFDKLRRAQDLLRHVIPNGDPAAIFDRALTLLLAELERAKLAATTGRIARRLRLGRTPATSRRCEADGLGAGRRPVRVPGDERPLHRGRFSRFTT